MHHAGIVAVELHEHQVPDFDVAIAVFLGRTRRPAPDVGAVVEENLRARTARAGVGHLPEVVGSVARALVVADAHDALGRHADLLVPDVVGFVVFLVHRDPQLVFRQAVDAGQQFPGVVDRLFFEIIAKREIAEHFKKRMVARGIADVFQVVVLAAGAHAALRGGRARIAALVVAEEHILELHHAGVGEQQGRIVARHQARGTDDGVLLRFKEFKELVADFSRFHVLWPRGNDALQTVDYT